MSNRPINACPQVRTMKLKDLFPVPENPRTISDDALKGLSKSLERFGCVEPLIVNVRGGANRIVGGHQRYKVLKEAGVEECLVIVVDMDRSEEHLLNVSLNNPNIQGEFSDGLAGFMDELRSGVGEDVLQDLMLDELSPINLDEERPEVTREKLEPFKRVHVLLSFPPEALPRIQQALESIKSIQEVEYEESAN